MPKFSDFDARIFVDGTPLPEYAESKTVDAAGVTTVSCWVPSEAGKAFSVRWTDVRPPAARPSIAGYVDADGVYVRGTIVRAQNTADKGEIAGKDVDGVQRAIVFSELDLTDDDSVLSKSTHEHMGEIHLRLRCVRLLGTVPMEPPTSWLSSEKVHERSKKAGAHRIQMGASLGAAPTTMEKVEYDGPMLVRFVFRYRPLALLQATDIAPLPARVTPPQSGATSASRSPTQQPVPHMTQEETDEERRLEARLAELKRKRGEATASGRKKVKTDAKAEPLSHAGHFTDGEVIDLSED